jgi:hypothetical protein
MLAPPNNDARRVAHPNDPVESVDDLIARRLDPVRIAADLVATEEGIEALARTGTTTTFAVVAVSFGSWPNAVAILDGAQNAREFIRRFNTTGVPSLWPARAIVGVRVFAVDPADLGGLAGIERGRWYLPAADGSDRLVDPTTRRLAVPGVDRATRRRGRSA